MNTCANVTINVCNAVENLLSVRLDNWYTRKGNCSNYTIDQCPREDGPVHCILKDVFRMLIDGRYIAQQRICGYGVAPLFRNNRF